MTNGRVTIEMGGKRSYDVPLGLSIEIEEATGRSLTELAADAARLRFGHALIIVGKLMEHHGADVTFEKLVDMAQDVGVATVMVDAAKILNAFFARPKTVKGTKPKGKQTPAAPAASL